MKEDPEHWETDPAGEALERNDVQEEVLRSFKHVICVYDDTGQLMNLRLIGGPIIQMYHLTALWEVKAVHQSVPTLFESMQFRKLSYWKICTYSNRALLPSVS